MKRAALFLLCAALPFAAPAQQPDCNAPGTQLDINACAGADFAKADAELNGVWKNILARYKDQPLFLDKLKASQRLWLQFRDAELEALYPVAKGQDERREYGSMYPTCYSGAKARLTRQRTEQLKAWLDGAQEGDTCSGSIKNSADLK
ncbi:lysozyme inhibitor LprI family protein [Dyella marensis]|jgi:uncharacterized protein YecT (DUF1311 family)|uniref:Uncharacterized conserved protein YecT, DUF1311 family n=1 Tax=Dyella marensis TaxID=500610 RepID=A0A1I2IB67_9GAMM|nr:MULTISPECIES: lysozyme inhibitor LprI family protein [Dyella]SFF38357.1 Uncharacterized conserved protein YecT, DUF1311 family [Dyella marensis]